MSASTLRSERRDGGRWSRRFARERGLYMANGVRWFGYHLMDRSAGKASRFFARRVYQFELEHGLPGLNTPENMARVWTEWDWSQGGEEWNLGNDWRRSVEDDLMLPRIPPASTTLEIGPGAGRWSSALQSASEKLILVDITALSLEMCRKRFGGCSNVEYYLTDGSGLPNIADASVDFIWSFDVFVHIAPDDQRSYMRDLARVMRPGATAVIHHAGDGGLSGNMRSSMTRELFAELVRANGLRLLDQFERWGDDGCFGLPVEGDVVSVFAREQIPAGSTSVEACRQLS
jgi:SAM-dependent methyltransferase